MPSLSLLLELFARFACQPRAKAWDSTLLGAKCTPVKSQFACLRRLLFGYGGKRSVNDKDNPSREVKLHGVSLPLLVISFGYWLADPNRGITKVGACDLSHLCRSAEPPPPYHGDAC